MSSKWPPIKIVLMFYNFDEFKINGGKRNYCKVQTQQQIGCLAFLRGEIVDN